MESEYLFNYQFEEESSDTRTLEVVMCFSDAKTINYELIFQNSPLEQQRRKATNGTNIPNMTKPSKISAVLMSSNKKRGEGKIPLISTNCFSSVEINLIQSVNGVMRRESVWKSRVFAFEIGRRAKLNCGCLSPSSIVSLTTAENCWNFSNFIATKNNHNYVTSLDLRWIENVGGVKNEMNIELKTFALWSYFRCRSTLDTRRRYQVVTINISHNENRSTTDKRIGKQARTRFLWITTHEIQ